MLVAVANGARGLELAAQPGLDRVAGFARGAEDDLDVTLVEDIDRAAAHAAGNDDLGPVVREEVGEEAGLVAGVGDGLLTDNLAVGRVEEDEILTASLTWEQEVAGGYAISPLRKEKSRFSGGGFKRRIRP